MMSNRIKNIATIDVKPIVAQKTIGVAAYIDDSYPFSIVEYVAFMANDIEIKDS